MAITRIHAEYVGPYLCMFSHYLEISFFKNIISICSSVILTLAFYQEYCLYLLSHYLNVSFFKNIFAICSHVFLTAY